jgi:hypothetical protein
VSEYKRKAYRKVLAYFLAENMWRQLIFISLTTMNRIITGNSRRNWHKVTEQSEIFQRSFRTTTTTTTHSLGVPTPACKLQQKHYSIHSKSVYTPHVKWVHRCWHEDPL